MLISELQAELEKIKQEHGDLPCFWYGCGNYHELKPLGDGSDCMRIDRDGSWVDDEFKKHILTHGVYF